MIFTKYFCFFFFLTLVKSNDPIQQPKQNFLTCLINSGLNNNKIINSRNKFTRKFEKFLLKKSIEILRLGSKRKVKKIAKSLYEYVCKTDEQIQEVNDCCVIYGNELTDLKENKDLIDRYEKLVCDWSNEDKNLPTVLREDNMTIDEGYELGDTCQIVVLTGDTEDTDRIKLDRYN
ncbi:uncharacterized protein LOC126899686 isoform X1 [Daktulosphaira vitifoliae]|uniref:uncharacterized protein LOC126899686 isoform X1 n=1 Tax=Daktulosphaira vitifoliae TaxID=58002 RepID=UPI0021AA517C|nr:uncharacterized protein LOC126899686 isoform X1 [Daktulosphaira vitifoliae]